MTRTKNKILIVEDSLVWREKYKKWLGERYDYVDSADALNAVKTFDMHLPDLVLLDLGLPEINQGLELLDNIMIKSTDVAVIVITSSKDHRHALESQERGAISYFFKGENIKDELPFLVSRALKMQALQRENKKLRQKLDRVFNFDNIIAVSKPMHNILALVEKIRTSNESVLITGESGVGKEVIARHLHNRSNRQKSPFIAINCAAMPETLLENELFGHERGAFTGATDLKLGKIELASRGTLFLDEIGDIPIALQAKLLRILQEKKFYRLGGTSEIKVNFRLIAATNKDLVNEVKAKRFREDLYYRLNVIPIHIPPLRERPDDIPALIDYFIQQYCIDNHLPVPRVDGALITYMSRCNWEGNIRQLENTLKRMLVLNHRSLTLTDLPGELNKNSSSFLQDALERNLSLEDVSKKYVLMVLQHFEGNKKEACKFLNINFRTLQRKIEE
jgi:DNA-binding NtrC family response regulator